MPRSLFFTLKMAYRRWNLTKADSSSVVSTMHAALKWGERDKAKEEVDETLFFFLPKRHTSHFHTARVSCLCFEDNLRRVGKKRKYKILDTIVSATSAWGQQAESLVSISTRFLSVENGTEHFVLSGK